MTDPKEVLHRYLQQSRDALLWKLEGLSEYDVRRPLVPTGTNLLGLVKHVASVEAGYLGEIFDRPSPESLPWFDDGAEDNADMWATADQSREFITDLYKRVWVHSDETIDALPLDAPGVVPWWREETKNVTLQTIIVHMIAETNRHAGHADIVRELIDGRAGRREADLNLDDSYDWPGHVARVEAAARQASAGA
jgi:uncharacterized damage-inducible protein DinB